MRNLIIVLIDDTMPPIYSETSKPLQFINEFSNPETDETFEFICAIKLPFQHHYNVLLKNPYLTYQNKVKGYFLHNGLTNNGRIQKIDQASAKDLRPYIVIYKKSK